MSSSDAYDSGVRHSGVSLKVRVVPLSAAGIACVVVIAACGGRAAITPTGPAVHMHTPAGAVLRPSPVRVSGGTDAQRALLRDIVRRFGPTQIRALRVKPAPQDWHPSPGDVELVASVRAVPGEEENSRGAWETWLVSGAFRDRSSALGLPRVVVTSPPGPNPAPADPRGLDAFTATVRAGAAASGAKVLAIRTGRPDGFSAVVALQVSNPGWFLEHRLNALELRFARVHSDGIYLEVYESSGARLYLGGSSARLTVGESGVVDPQYRSCYGSGSSGPTLVLPLPCPSTWRPPPSTPLKRLEIVGGEQGGRSLGALNGRAGSTVAYLPNTTIGLGMVVANPNGHPVTIEAITTDVPSRAPIRFTGARIRIPPSRYVAGDAVDFQAPYPPVAPFAPFTIQPGSWFSVDLHYLITPSCSPSNAGTTIVENRTFTITYRIQGDTMHDTYADAGTPLNLTFPKTCPR
jgi:hypothetical protein